MANLPRPRKPVPRRPLGPASSIVSKPDGTYAIEPPTAEAPGKSLRETIRLEIFGRKSSERAQARRVVDRKTGQLVQASTGEKALRDRPEFIRGAMLGDNPELRQIVFEEFQNADPAIKTIIAQEIAERFPATPVPGGRTEGFSPQGREIIDFLQTGQLSPERMRAIEEAGVAAPRFEQTRERTQLGKGHPDVAAETFDVDPDAPVDMSPESNLPSLPAPGDPMLDEGTRPFPQAQGVDLKLVNDRLENRPYLRTGAGAERVRGDKVNPNTERFTTDFEVIDGRRVPVRIAPNPSAGSIGPQDNPAIHAARQGRRPYFATGRAADLRAERSVAEGGAQRALAEALQRLGTGSTGAEDLVWNLVKRESNPALSPSDLNSGVPDAEALVDHALSLITDPNVRGMIASQQGFDGWRAQAVDALNQRFWAPEGSVERLTPQEVARRDAAFDADAIDPMASADSGPTYPGDLDAIPQDAGDLFNRTGEVIGRGPGGENDFVISGPPTLKPGPRRQNVQGIHGEGPLPEQPPQIGAEGNVGLAGEPQSLRASQARDPFPGVRTATGGMEPGITREGRPVSRIPGRGPRKGEDASRDVDDLPARQNITEIVNREPIRLRDGEVLSVDDGTRVYPDGEGNVEISQADPQELARRQAVLYALDQGRVVYSDPDSGDTISRAIGRSMKPESINKVRALAKSQWDESLHGAFDSLWPAGEPPLPEYFRWAQNPTALPARPAPSATTATAPVRSEPAPWLGDAEALERTRAYYDQFGFPRDRVPPGWTTNPRTGEIVPSRYFDDPNVIGPDDGTPSIFDLGPEGSANPEPTPPKKKILIGSQRTKQPPATDAPAAPAAPSSPEIGTDDLDAIDSGDVSVDGPQLSDADLEWMAAQARASEESRRAAPAASPEPSASAAPRGRAAAPPASAADLGEQAAWNKVNRILLDEEGTPIPEAAAAATDIAREVARILSDPKSKPRDINWATGHYEQFKADLDLAQDPVLRQQYIDDVLRPIDEALGVDADYSLPSAPEATPAPAPVPARAPTAAAAANNVEEALDAAASEIDDVSPAAVVDDGPPLPAEIREAMEKSGYVWDSAQGKYVKPDAEPSSQSADNTRPQEPPALVEEQSRINANNSEAPRDVEAQKVDEQSRTEAGWADTGVLGHLRRNWLRYGLGGGAYYLYANSGGDDYGDLPYPESPLNIPPPAPYVPPGQQPAQQPEQRIRAIRRRQEPRHQPQSTWRIN